MIRKMHHIQSNSYCLRMNSLFWVLLFNCFILVACEQAQPDRSFLEGSPCLAPCWQDITPGITDEASALSILSNPDLVIQEQLTCKVNNDDPARSRCMYRRTSNEGGSIGVSNGIVEGIELMARQLTLADVTDSLGAPNFISELDEFYDSEVGYCYRMYVYYLKGIRLHVTSCVPDDISLNTPFDDELIVFEEMQVVSMLFFQPANTLEVSLNNISRTNQYDFSGTYMEKILVEAQPWKGYGQYSLIFNN